MKKKESSVRLPAYFTQKRASFKFSIPILSVDYKEMDVVLMLP